MVVKPVMISDEEYGRRKRKRKEEEEEEEEERRRIELRTEVFNSTNRARGLISRGTLMYQRWCQARKRRLAVEELFCGDFDMTAAMTAALKGLLKQAKKEEVAAAVWYAAVMKRLADEEAIWCAAI